MPITILLADDHEIVREGLRTLFNSQPDMEVVGEAPNGRLAVQRATELLPNVVLMDVQMPDMNGVEATRQIVDQVPNTRIIALSVHSHQQFVSEMLKAGASGYLHKNCTFDELLRAVRTAVAGQIYLSPGITGALVDDYIGHLSQHLGHDAPAAQLTDREREVLQLLAEGKSAKEIALQLRLSGKTVEGYRRQIMNKLNLHSIAELTKYAILHGLAFLES